MIITKFESIISFTKYIIITIIKSNTFFFSKQILIIYIYLQHHNIITNLNQFSFIMIITKFESIISFKNTL